MKLNKNQQTVSMIYRLLIVLICLFSACSKGIQNETSVYLNTFENGDLSNISGGTTSEFNRTKVLGNYNNGGFLLSLIKLEKHDLIEISFDLYTHDSWDGNEAGAAGPDIWQMKLDDDKIIATTFSNFKCESGFCLPQSYPRNYPNFNNNPGTEAFEKNLPGFCSTNTAGSGTNLYKIKKTLSHSKRTLKLECLDFLKQERSSDKKCDESWSIDNLSIKTISLK